MKKIFLLTIITVLFVGCASSDRLPIYAADAAAGTLAYKLLENESQETQILGSLAAAGVTHLAGDYIHGEVQKGKIEKYEEGYRDGQANSAKNTYWIIQKMQREGNKENVPVYTTYEFPGAEKKDGIKYLPHTVKLRVIEDVKK